MSASVIPLPRTVHPEPLMGEPGKPFHLVDPQSRLASGRDTFAQLIRGLLEKPECDAIPDELSHDELDAVKAVSAARDLVVRAVRYAKTANRYAFTARIEDREATIRTEKELIDLALRYSDG